MRFNGPSVTRRGRMLARIFFTLFVLMLLAIIFFFSSEPPIRTLAEIGTFIGATMISGLTAYLIARALRRRNTGGFHRAKLFAVWFFYSVSIAIIFSGILLFGSADLTSSFFGGARFGFLMGSALAFWMTLLPTLPEESQDAGLRLRRSWRRSELQISGMVAGLIAGVALTVYILAPLLGHLAG